MNVSKTILKFIATLTIFFFGSWLHLNAIAAAKPESKTVAQARELIDADYGNGNILKAIPLLEMAFKADPDDANVFVQAARIIVKNGQLSFNGYRNNTWESYSAFIEKALEIDPSNAKAHILKAQVFGRQRNYAEELNELDKAKASGTDDPWLLFGYGDHYLNVRSLNDAASYFEQVESRGPGVTASERKAFIAAIYELSQFKMRNEVHVERIRKYASLALKNRYPTDAWTPQGYAELFIRYQFFDEAIVYARESLKTMDFGAGRMTLAVSLYGKAAQLIVAKRPMQDAKPFIDEANSFGFAKSDIIGFIGMCSVCRSWMGAMTPTLNEIIPN